MGDANKMPAKAKDSSQDRPVSRKPNDPLALRNSHEMILVSTDFALPKSLTLNSFKVI